MTFCVSQLSCTHGAGGSVRIVVTSHTLAVSLTVSLTVVVAGAVFVIVTGSLVVTVTA